MYSLRHYVVIRLYCVDFRLEEERERRALKRMFDRSLEEEYAAKRSLMSSYGARDRYILTTHSTLFPLWPNQIDV